ncbi:MAG: FAD-dependent oxidoreductase, partial [Gammaproteobacteria bacterium]
MLELALKYRISMITRAADDAYDRQGLKLKLELRGRELSNEDYFLVSDEMENVLESIAKHADMWITNAEEPWTSPRLLKNRLAPPLTLDDLDKLSVAKALQDLYRVQQNTYLWDMLIHLLVNDEVAPLEQMNFLGLLCKVKGGQGKRLGRPFRQKPPEARARDERQRIMGYWHELEIFRCADGCEALAMEMRSEIEKRHRVKLHLRTAVTNIHLTNSGVLIGSRAVRDGKVSEDPPVPAFYDFVVFTIPPTVWSKVSVIAGGTLNKEKTKVVGGKPTNLAADPDYVMASGDCIKFFTTASDRFWLQHPPAAPYGGTLKLGQVWEGTDNQTDTGRQQVAVLSVFAGPLIADTLKPGGKSFRVPSEKECLSELRRLYGKRYPAKTNTKNTRYANWPQTPFIM